MQDNILSTGGKENNFSDLTEKEIPSDDQEDHGCPRTHVISKESHDEERGNERFNSHLRTILAHHKRLMEKDILNKRALVEKELNIEIQKELEMELATIRKVKSHEKNEMKVGGAKRKSEIEVSQQVGKSSCGEKSKGRQKGLKGKTLLANRPKKEKLYCLCNTPYDKSKFYIRCDICAKWFHGKCVGISKEMSRSLTEFACAKCHDARKTQKLYCVCKQPYDETKFYIHCDKCKDWFHGRCVGILQSEADAIDEYVCPNCEKDSLINFANMKNLDNNDLDHLKTLMTQIVAHKSAWPFMEPVDPEEAPNYYEIIKEPMDLRTIELSVQEKEYKTLNEFISDMTKIFENCRYYNPADSQTPYFKCAQTLEKYFVFEIKKFREKLSEKKNEA